VFFYNFRFITTFLILLHQCLGFYIGRSETNSCVSQNVVHKFLCHSKCFRAMLIWDLNQEVF